MSSDKDSFLGLPLLATAILVAVFSSLLFMVGQILKINGVSSWELLLVIGFFVSILSLLMGLTWAVRVLWTYAAGGDRDTESA